MNGLLIGTFVLLKYKDRLVSSSLVLGDYIRRTLKVDKKIITEDVLVQGFCVNPDDIVIIYGDDNNIYDLSMYETSKISAYSLTLKQIKKQLDYIISIDYLPSRHVSTYENCNMMIRKSNADEFKEVFGDKSKVDVLIYYGEYF